MATYLTTSGDLGLANCLAPLLIGRVTLGRFVKVVRILATDVGHGIRFFHDACALGETEALVPPTKRSSRERLVACLNHHQARA